MRVPLRQAEECKPRLRLEAEAARLSVGILGFLEAARESLNVTLQVPGPRDRARIHRLRESLTGDARLVERGGPVSVQPLELCSVHEATAAKRDEIGLLFAPPRQCRRPFLRSAELVHLFAGEDDSAVHDPGDDR